MRVLCLVPYPSEAPSNRLRVEQYVPYLTAHGVEVELRPFVSPTLYRMLYEPRRFGAKAWHFLRAALGRLADLQGARQADVVVVHREAFPVGPSLLERWLAGRGHGMVYDFDDAIFLPHASAANRFARWLRSPGRVGAAIRASSEVIAGNAYLAAYARRYHRRVTVIPTPVDTDAFAPRAPRPPADTIVIGWIGTHSTASFLRELDGPLAALCQRYPQVEMRVVGGSYLPPPGVRAVVRPWQLSTERAELEHFDVGLMPLPDDDWSLGKCGFKLLLYMAMAIPAVCSPVGVNTEIVADGATGFHARSPGEWYAKLERLILDPELRTRAGRAGQAVVEEHYSLRVQAPRFLAVLERAAGARRAEGRETPVSARLGGGKGRNE